MGAVKVHEFMALDGVIDEPTWTADYGFDPKMGGAIAEAMAGCRGILLGRTTYEMFEPAWSNRTDDDYPGAPFFNDTPKYVVSGTLRTTSWRNSTVIGPYDPGAIRRLKKEADGDLYVSGSAALVRAMIAELSVSSAARATRRARTPRSSRTSPGNAPSGHSPQPPSRGACRAGVPGSADHGDPAAAARDRADIETLARLRRGA
jgi:dihydrofolate reductase